MSGCDWCGYTGSGWDPEHVAHRIDPPGCGCTDCQGGYSKPLDVATDYELALMRRGIVDNATYDHPPWDPEALPVVSVDTTAAEDTIRFVFRRLREIEATQP